MKSWQIKRRSKKGGLPPGSLIHIGEQRAAKTRLCILEYDADNARERKDVGIDECHPPEGKNAVAWIDAEGLNDIGVMAKLGERFGLHPLVMEDVLNTGQRPKVEDYGSYLYIVLKMLCLDEKGGGVAADQVSIILGKNFVISIQEGELDVFDPIRERIRSGKGKTRRMGAGYLAYSLIDAIVDNYFEILEKFGDEMEYLEDELIKNPSRNILQKIHSLKRDILFLRRAIWPLRELAGSLERGESELMGEGLRVYLRDLYDHVAYLVDTIETFREMLSGMLDIYLSSINFRTNEIMKVLTIIATLFMPLSFIVGIYGMNFKHMPELGWRYGYAAVWAVMVGVVIIMFAYLRRKKWL